MTKIYVVQARSFEYNDETYDSSDGGNVIHAYSSLAAAETAKINETLNSLRNGCLSYLAEQYDVLDDAAYEMLMHYGLEPKGEWLGYYEAEDISEAIKSGKITNDDLRILATGLKPGRELYFIEEVEID